MRASSAPFRLMVFLCMAGVGLRLYSAERSGAAEGANPTHEVPEGEGRSRAVRMIDDPSTHQRWVLLKDQNHAAGPARLVPVTSDLDPAVWHWLPSHPVPVIHSGDRITVTQHTSVCDLHLEAVALGSAARGNVLRVRLKTSGRILPVMANDAGRAVLLTVGNGVRW